MTRIFTPTELERGRTVPVFASVADRQMTEAEIAGLALATGMAPRDVIGLLDSMARWRAMGIG